MSSELTLTFTGERNALPPRAAIDAMLHEHTETRLDDADVQYTEQHDDVPASTLIELYDRKWGLPGADDVAEALSASYPEALVTLVEEWDGHDEDETAGAHGTRWRAGEVVATGATEFVWHELRLEDLRPDDRPGPNVGDMVTILFAGRNAEVTGTVTAVTGSHVVLDHGLDYNLALANRWEVSPGPYGYGATPEHIARVDAEVARQREQAARRRAERPAKTDRNPSTPHKSGETHA